MNILELEVFKKSVYSHFISNNKSFLLSNQVFLSLMLGDICNAKCKFCISSLVHDKIVPKLDEHRKNQIRFAVETMGVKDILIVGGEPTIHNNFFEHVDYLKTFESIEKICVTTNGHKFIPGDNPKETDKFMKKFIGSGITHLNLSLMSWDSNKQKLWNGTNKSLSAANVSRIYGVCQEYDVNFRINTNVFIGNNGTIGSMLDFLCGCRGRCDSVKFSPLLLTDSFSVVNEVNKFNRERSFSQEGYDKLFHEFEDQFKCYPIVRNKETFGFVEYSTILTPFDPAIVLNYNHRGRLREVCLNEDKINSVKLLPTNELSLSWNREEADMFIDTTEE